MQKKPGGGTEQTRQIERTLDYSIMKKNETDVNGVKFLVKNPNSRKLKNVTLYSSNILK